MFSNLKTAWKALGLATQARKAWKRGGGAAAAGGTVALVLDPKPAGEVVYAALAYLVPELAAALPRESAVEVLGVLAAMLAGWIIGATKDVASEKGEQRAANKRAARQAGAGGA